MYKRIFDKIALSYLVVIMIIFIMIILYASNATRQNLIAEKQGTLENQSRFICEEYILPYQQKKVNQTELQRSLNQVADSLNIKIWYSDTDGSLLFLSHPEEYDTLPDNLYDLDRSGSLTGTFTMVGDFYAFFRSRWLPMAARLTESRLQMRASSPCTHPSARFPRS